MSDPSVTSFAVQSAFELVGSPFDECSDDTYFFPGEQHVRALEFMGRTLWTRERLSVVTAATGCGKSVLIARLLRHLDERIVAAAVSRDKLGPREFLLEMLRQFGFSLEETDKSDRRRLLERFLSHQASSGRVCALIVENAQAMHPSVLEELRHLVAAEVDGARTLKVLLLGQPALNHVLESPRMAELEAGQAPRFKLLPLDEGQTAAYIEHRLRAAGAADPDALMPAGLVPLIYACTDGVPAQINKLSQQALKCAAAQAAPFVTPEAMEQAIVDLGLTERALAAHTHMYAQDAVAEIPADAPQQMEQEPTEDLKPDASQDAKLLVAMQGMPEYELPLGEYRLLIGRGDEADVRIDSVFVSRYHALIVRNAGQDLLLDLGSTNGVLVNSHRTVRHVLQHRDLVQVGPARVTYLNPVAGLAARPDPAETICFARPGFAIAAGEEDETAAVLAFGRHDTPADG